MTTACQNCFTIELLKSINDKMDHILKKLEGGTQRPERAAKKKRKRFVIEDEDDSETSSQSSDDESAREVQSIFQQKSKSPGITDEQRFNLMSPHESIMGTVKYHVVDGPYIIGDPRDIKNEEDNTAFTDKRHHYIRWLVNSKEVSSFDTPNEGMKHVIEPRPLFYYCDWKAQIVENTHPQQIDCDYRWLEWAPEKEKEPFLILPKFYSYEDKKVYDFSAIKKHFMKRSRNENQLWARRSDILEAVESALGVSHFKFGSDANRYASEELRDWAVYHHDPQLAIFEETILDKPTSGTCHACNLNRTIHSHWGSNMQFGKDCATRLRCLFKLFDASISLMNHTPTEKEFNTFIFKFIGIYEELKGLKISNNKIILEK